MISCPTPSSPPPGWYLPIYNKHKPWSKLQHPQETVQNLQAQLEQKIKQHMPAPTSNMEGVPLSGNVQPRSSARNFAIYKQERRGLLLADAVTVPGKSPLAIKELSRDPSSQQNLCHSFQGVIQAVYLNFPGPAFWRGCRNLPASSLDGFKNKQTNGINHQHCAWDFWCLLLAFPAECHYYHSKGNGPHRGVARGTTLQNWRQAVVEGH